MDGNLCGWVAETEGRVLQWKETNGAAVSGDEEVFGPDSDLNGNTDLGFLLVNHEPAAGDHPEMEEAVLKYEGTALAGELRCYHFWYWVQVYERKLRTNMYCKV